MQMPAASCQPSAAGLSTWRTPIGLAIAIFLFYLSLTPWTTLWDRDEPRFAQAAVEMLDSGQYLYPTFNGDLRPQKPILIYWLMTLTVRLFGPTELAVRFWSPVGLALAAFFTYIIGRRLLSPRAGLIAMVIVSFNPLAMIEAIAATTDAVLLAGTTGAVAACVSVRRGVASAAPTTRTLWRLFALIAALTVAQFTKGPVGLVLPLLVVGGALLVGRDVVWGRKQLRVELAVASLTSLVLFALWAVPATLATDGRLAAEGLGREHLQRMFVPMEGHGGSFFAYLPFYVPVALVGFAPWTIYLPAVVWAMATTRIWSGQTRALLLGWIIFPLLFFSVAATKLPHYILPIWPALALAVAGVLEAERSGSLSAKGETWLKHGLYLGVLVLVLELAALALGAYLLPAMSLRLASVAIAVTILTTAVMAFHAHAAGQFQRAAVQIFAGTVGAQLLVGLWLLPAFDALKPVPAIAAAIRERSGPSVPVATYEFGEPSLDFYVNRPPLRRLTHVDVGRWAREPQPGILVTTRSALGPVLKEGRLPLKEIAARRGINVAKGRAVELLALERQVLQ